MEFPSALACHDRMPEGQSCLLSFLTMCGLQGNLRRVPKDVGLRCLSRMRVQLQAKVEGQLFEDLPLEQGSWRGFSMMAALIRSSGVASDDLVGPPRRVLRL
ncbi:hypothetical protein VNO77_15241 [Canavalia gladiata]|uniref:Uncharacterized protein n=1 Tax=Canavalia gladiata TaxID=3824 RepID=A0AAN9LYU9_CANGL